MKSPQIRYAQAIGNAIGKPDLKWVTMSDGDALQALRRAGLSKEIARNFHPNARSIGFR
jgi:hypothetical protein